MTIGSHANIPGIRAVSTEQSIKLTRQIVVVFYKRQTGRYVCSGQEDTDKQTCRQSNKWKGRQTGIQWS